jgi:ornithine cyclodeaminase/alanine dehydrogenase-like protein (mu-crystallin family)
MFRIGAIVGRERQRVMRSMSVKGDDALRKVLSVHDEPQVHVDELRVHALLSDKPRDYLSYVRQGIVDLGKGAATMNRPPKQIFNTGVPEHGDFRVMPCVWQQKEQSGAESKCDSQRAASAAAAVVVVEKTVKIVGTNVRGDVVPNQITVGKAFRLHPIENFVTHTFDACLLSSARTGACSALGIDFLSDERSRQKVVIVGSGRVGLYTGLYASCLAGTRDIVFVDREPSMAEHCSVALRALLDDAAIEGRRVSVAQSLAQCVGDADVVVAATTAAEPFLHPSDVGERALVVSVGADIDTQRELHHDWASAADIFVEAPDSAACGDLLAWHRSGHFEQSQIRANLVQLAQLNFCPLVADRRRVFVSTGSALFDNRTIAYLLDRL